MGMVVRSNIMAVNAQRQLGMNNSQVGKSLEKLSSGYRINRAGDDASGLAISEKMKAQIRGLDTASLNAQDGVSVVQTAEGALTEVHNMLNRMTELATRAANGINSDENRQSLQDEVTELQTEIDRISKATNFNSINLLDGSLGGGSGASKVSHMLSGAGTATDVTQANGAKQSQELTISAGSVGKDQVLSFKYVSGGTLKTAEITFKGGAALTNTADNAVAELKKMAAFADFEITNNGGKIKFEAKENGVNDFQVTEISQVNDGKTLTTGVSAGTVTLGKDDYFDVALAGVTDPTKDSFFEVDGKKFQILKDGATAKPGYIGLYTDDGKVANEDQAQALVNQLKAQGIDAKVHDTTKTTIQIKYGASGGSGLRLQIGDTADSFNQLTVSINDMSSKGIGVSGVNISTVDGAASAIDTIRAGIDKVSAQRAVLGATQNRLEYTINNLDTTSENLQSANSRIRDTDMAKMMMEYTKMNVLTQSAQAMLAQANQQPQSVLQLLQ